MEPVVQAVLITAVSSMSGPIFLAYLNGYQRRRERREDYARQDRAAAKVEETARLLLERQMITDAKTAEAARLLKINQSKVEGVAQAAALVAEDLRNGITDVHTLVNSNLTDAKKRELEAMKLSVLMMRKVLEVTRSRPTETERSDIDSAEERIDVLTRELANKDKVQDNVSERKGDV